MVGTVQDVTEGRKAEREHRIAETLQRSLLPDRLPEVPGMALAARYVPASADMAVGGDWWDVQDPGHGRIIEIVRSDANVGEAKRVTVQDQRAKTEVHAEKAAQTYKKMGEQGFIPGGLMAPRKCMD